MTRPRTMGPLRRGGVVVAALLVSAGLAAPAEPDRRDVAPMVSPDRIDDAPTNQRDAARQFRLARLRRDQLALPPDDSGRGVPDRRTKLGNSGKRVWETFKSDYELFAVGDDGRRVAPAPWASYAGRNPCGSAIDNRQKTIASFAPFADFNQPSFAVDEPANPLVTENGAYTRYEIHFNEPEFTAFAASGWSRGLNLPDESHPARFPVGSIAVKAAWRPLTAADPPSARSRDYVERAQIVDVAKTLAAGRVSLLGERRRAGWAPHRDQDPQPAAMDLEHIRACRQRAARGRGRGSRTRRARRQRPLCLFRPLAAETSGRRSARAGPCRSTGRTRRSAIRRRCRSCAAIRSTRRSWL